MVSVYAICQVKKGCEDSFLKVATRLVRHTRAEVGNISYHFSKEEGKELTYVFTELWKDNEAVEKHLKESHFVEAEKELKFLLDKPLDIHKMQVVV